MKFSDVARGYENMWDKATIRPERRGVAHDIARKLTANRARYEISSVPWWWVAITHHLESGGNFKTHLHNGDPLTARTKHVPAGRPKTGEPPFTWEVSALDALQLKGLDDIAVADWTIPRALWEFERYNGLGYFGRGVNSPYLWSFTTLYTKGKYVADGKYDANAVSEQAGTVAILKALIELGSVVFTKERDYMQDLQQILAAYKHVAPQTAAASPELASKALAEAMDIPPAEATPKIVVERMEAMSLTGVVGIIQAAEALIGVLTSTVAPKPVPAVPAVPAASPNDAPAVAIDNVLGGETFKGAKTFIGVGVYALVSILDALNVAPGLLTPGVVEAIQWGAGALAGVGLIAKVERYLVWFKKPVTK